VLAVGSPEQVESMETVEANGLLGCFALTEKLAGVQSGLVVQTTADYDAASETFILHNVGDTEGAYKNWISQGFVADKAVVLADLTVGGERKGPHAFLMDMRKAGKLEPGVRTGDQDGRQRPGQCVDRLRPRQAATQRAALALRLGEPLGRVHTVQR